MQRGAVDGATRVGWVHEAAKKIWTTRAMTPAAMQARCIDAWERAGREIGTTFTPLVPVDPDRPVIDVIFGSGGFSTGEFQARQFEVARSWSKDPPVRLGAIVSNKSERHGSNASKVARKHGVPLVELDFIDWYRDNVDPAEDNPVRASRYWFPPGDPARPDQDEIARRFALRQERFHGDLGKRLEETVGGPIDIASARGYNFQFCGAMFRGQARPPHVNDTHPADLSYVDRVTGAKRYPGWQAGAIDLMLADGHDRFRGSLIEVPLMNDVSQIDELDEGALLAIGGGVDRGPEGTTSAGIQARMKEVDDFVFCTLEPAGLLLAWGISKDPVPVTFQEVNGDTVDVVQHAIIVGNEIRSGVNAFGRDLHEDLARLVAFLAG